MGKTPHNLKNSNFFLGLYYRRVSVDYSSSVHEYINEEDIDCYQCLGVTGDQSLHSKISTNTLFEGAEEIPLVWDGTKCVFNCPKGFKVNYRVSTFLVQVSCF